MIRTFTSIFKHGYYSIAILVGIGFTSSMQAQTEKGTVSFGLHNFSPSGINVDGVPANLFGKGSFLGLSWGTTKIYKDGELMDNPQTQYTLGLNLSAHYFPADRLSIGVVGSFFSGFSAYQEEDSEAGRYAARILLAGPEVRYYLGKGKTKAWVKASGALGGMNVWWDGQKGEPTYLTKFAVGTGASFFLTRNISLDLGLEYNTFHLQFENGIKGVNTNVAIDVGFGLYFGGKRGKRADQH